MRRVLVIGAGITGATLARRFAEEGYDVSVFEARLFVGGNCADVTIDHEGHYISAHGPHIFHTNNEQVWAFVTRFAEFRPYRHAVQTLTDVGWLPWPINKASIEGCYQMPWKSAQRRWAKDIDDAKTKESLTSFGSKARAAVGQRVYDLMLKGYTQKQWRRDPDTVPPEVFGRVRIVPSYDDNFFSDTHVALPMGGYTRFIETMLDHPHVHVEYGKSMHLQDVARLMEKEWFSHVFSTAAPDAFCGFTSGRMEYLSTQFQQILPNDAVVQDIDFPTPVVNFAQAELPIVRATNYRYLSNTTNDVVIAESSDANGSPMYPVRTQANTDLAASYISMLGQSGIRIQSVGRLGGFAYINMDEAVRDALIAVEMNLSL